MSRGRGREGARARGHLLRHLVVQGSVEHIPLVYPLARGIRANAEEQQSLEHDEGALAIGSVVGSRSDGRIDGISYCDPVYSFGVIEVCIAS